VKNYSLAHVADHVLIHDLHAIVKQDRCTTADMLAHLAEVDARRLYAPVGYPSMFAYSVGELRLSEDAAYRRIRAARLARQFPAILGMVADGRLNLNSVLMLGSHLTDENAEELLAAATHKTKSELELMLAARFPQPDLATLVQAVPAAPSHAPEMQACQLAPAPVGMTTTQQVAQQIAAPAPRPKLTPLAPQRFALQVTLSQQTHDKLRYAQELLGHAVPSGDMAQVLDRALDALIAKLERQKFAATSRMRPGRGTPKGRHVPAEVRRAVWLRDQGRCTFVSEKGHRCESRTRLELDHVDPVARGGAATVANLRLRCRAHNQYAAEKAFGAGFMQRKREASRRRIEEAKARNAAAATAGAGPEGETRAPATPRAAGERVGPGTPAADDARIAAALQELPWLRTIGERAMDARRHT